MRIEREQIELARQRAAVLGPGLAGRTLLVAAVIGLLAAMATGTMALVVAPLAAVVVVHLLRHQPIERLFLVTVAATLFLEHPSEVPYMNRWSAPWHPLGELWFHPLNRSTPIPVPFAPALLVAGWLLLRVLTSPGPRPGRYGRLYLQVSALAVAALAAAELYGLARHGDARQTFYQVAPLLETLALGAIACLLASRDLLRHLERLLLAAAAARAVLAIVVYLSVFRPAGTSYLYVTTHSDSVLWIVALAVLAGRLSSTFRLQPQAHRVAVALLIAVAVVVNNRRMAFVELGVVVVYAVWAAPPRLRRLRNRLLVAAAPLLLVYVTAALAAPPSRLFMPVQSLVSVNDQADSSTESREIENANLLVTIKQGGPLGIGFGHPYIEQTVGPDISQAFAQYRYLPHNSTLGLLAFAGPIGFIGFWLPFVTGMGAAVRLRRSDAQRLQAAGIWFVGAIAAHSLMAWGDIGLQSALNGLLGALGAGLAAGLCRDPRPAPAVNSASEGAPASRALMGSGGAAPGASTIDPVAPALAARPALTGAR